MTIPMISSADERLEHVRQARRQTFLALFTALAVAVNTLETLLPTPVPWFRLGLANALTVVVLFLYGSGAAWSLTLTRIGLGALLLGRLFSPGFWLALVGGCLATFSMVVARRLGKECFSPIGISALGAAAHACGQVLTAWLLLVRHPAVWQIFPVFLLFAVGAGVITGWVAAMLLDHLAQHPQLRYAAAERPLDDTIRSESS
jgi:heptaprenyl diphosphate synthase